MKLSSRGREAWTPDEARVLAGLDAPEKIQAYLDTLSYSAEPENISPRRVMRLQRAHCMDGALFAAAAMRFHGRGCRVVDLLAVRDDDHVIAVFRERGCWGSVSKSNFSGLRFREPVYRGLRELVMSYFDNYFNTAREKTLRGYSRPIDLRRYDHLDWMTTESDLDDPIGRDLSRARHTKLLRPGAERGLHLVDERSLAAGLVGANPAGLYVP